MQFIKNPLIWSIVGMLAVWRITNIIQQEEIAEPLRRKLGVTESKDDPDYRIYPDNFIGKVLECFWCGSVWVGGVVTITLFIFPPLLLPFALSAGAILVKDWLEQETSITNIENVWAENPDHEEGFSDYQE